MFYRAALSAIACVLTVAQIPESLAAKSNSSVQSPVIGSWTFDSNGCEETYHFSADGIRTVTANQEVVKARYQLRALRPQQGLYLITDTVISDNGKPDCSGDTSVMTGDTVQLLMRFQESPKRFSFCFDDALLDCVGPFIHND